MAPREELLVILDLTSTVLRAGVGVTDLIRGPLLELPTRIGRKRSTTTTPQVEDYLVGHYLSQAEATTPGNEDNSGDGGFEIVFPLIMDSKLGFTVQDWVGLEAIFRYALHTSLQLPRPPLAHPTVLSIPPGLPHSIVDKFHQLMFEKLLIPSLLLSSRPFFAAGASGINSGLILDIGWRGEGSEISIVHENQLFGGGEKLNWIDEGVLDDFLTVKIWETEKDHLLDGFKKALGREEKIEMVEILDGVRRIVGELKSRDLIGFESEFFNVKDLNLVQTDGVGGEKEEDGSFDVAKAVVEGKVSEIVNKKKNNNKSKSSSSSSNTPVGDYVTIPNPFSPPPPPAPIDLTVPVPEIPEHANLSIGPCRHLYLEPLFFPKVLSTHLTCLSESAKELGLTYFETLEAPQSGIQELLGNVLCSIGDSQIRESVSENLVVISSGRVASNKALGNTLIPLLSPYVQSPIPLTDTYSESGPSYNKQSMKFAKCPEYFSNFKKHSGDWSVYLGGCIMGKLLIGDQQSKLFMSKADYAQKGPAYYRQLDLIA
ncbi:hypothetical protein JCM3765_003824 [Sporobolomyces pararoseus]